MHMTIYTHIHTGMHTHPLKLVLFFNMANKNHIQFELKYISIKIEKWICHSEFQKNAEMVEMMEKGL